MQKAACRPCGVCLSVSSSIRMDAQDFILHQVYVRAMCAVCVPAYNTVFDITLFVRLSLSRTVRLGRKNNRKIACFVYTCYTFITRYFVSIFSRLIV